MFESSVVYTNRYNDSYYWKKLNENTFQFCMQGNGLEYCRVGAKEEASLDYQDLGMFDPSGGPYISLGTKIDGQKITRLYYTDADFYAEVEK